VAAIFPAASAYTEKNLPEMPWLPLEWDLNHDGRFTISDIGLWLQHAFFLPGDWLIWTSMRYWPELSRFLEVGSRHYGSSFSALISVFVWLAVMVTILTTSHWLAAMDRAVTRAIREALAAMMIKFRIVRRLIAESFRRRRARLTDLVSASQGPQLNAEELRVLKAHGYVRPPGTLALSDIVRATGVPRSQVVTILARLHELELLDAQEAENSNERAYALTEPGRLLAGIEKPRIGHI
jgi:DNA-binding MarR family transcriptional regulator